MQRAKRSAEPAPHYIDHRKRLKNRYRANGLDTFSDYETLELALSYAIPRKDLKPLAKALLARFKTLNNVLEAPLADLNKFHGISDHTALLLRLFKDISALYLKNSAADKDLISSPEAAVNYLKVLLKGCADEKFHLIFLDSGNRLLCTETLQHGTVNRSVVYPRQVVERAIASHCAGVIVAHNHPGGSLQPSDDDRKTTEAIRKALETIDVALLDHLIIAGNGYFSWKEHHLL
jgi:DNA repair protein RadC